MLELRDITKSFPGVQALAGVSLRLDAGKIHGLVGENGAGRTETARLLIGEDTPDSGAIFVRGERANIRSVQDSLHRYRIGYVSENRKEEGLLLEFPVGTNITITIWQRLRHRFTRRIPPAAEHQIAHDLVRSLAIKCTGLDQPTRDLSGGNQQKVCMAKWLAADCDYSPFSPLDIGSRGI
jgi:ribose transport system ATP-binding protein